MPVTMVNVSLYNTILSFHDGPRNHLLDLGTGHGRVARSLSPLFAQVTATDRSEGMISQARNLTNTSTFHNISYHTSAPESLSWVSDSSIDMVTSAQAAHWFDLPPFFDEMRRVVRPGGTLALWGYREPAFVGFPIATKILRDYSSSMEQGKLGRYWQQPGKSMVQDLLRDVKPPEQDWEVKRVDGISDGSLSGDNSRNGGVTMRQRLTLEQCVVFLRTWSAYHGWKEDNSAEKEDVVDEIFKTMRKKEEEWRIWGETWPWREVEMEWGTGLILAKRK